MFDKDNDGYITASELKEVLHSIGEFVSDSEAIEMIQEADNDGDDRIDFDGICVTRIDDVIELSELTSELRTVICVFILEFVKEIFLSNDKNFLRY